MKIKGYNPNQKRETEEPKNSICKHCTACGDVKACRDTECHQHESWYAQEQERRINALCMAIHNEGMYKQRYDMLRRSLFAILDSGCNNATMLARTEQAVNRHRGIKPVGTPMAHVDPVDPVKQNKIYAMYSEDWDEYKEEYE